MCHYRKSIERPGEALSHPGGSHKLSNVATSRVKTATAMEGTWRILPHSTNFIS
jgi:predicted naringenin-chalcone synthase